MKNWYDAAKDYANSVTGENHSAFADAVSALFNSWKTNGTNGVVAQTAPADLGSAPTAADFNGLLAKLKTAGVLK